VRISAAEISRSAEYSTPSDIGVDAREHAAELAAPGDGAKPIGVERVERDVDAGQARARERLGQLGEQMAVRRHHDLLDACDPCEPRDELDEAPAYGRLAAGQPDLADAQASEQRDDLLELLERQQRRPRLEVQRARELFRHAVRAAVVAAVGDRDAQVTNASRERVEQGVVRRPGKRRRRHR
jgi:hypothetical protein